MIKEIRKPKYDYEKIVEELEKWLSDYIDDLEERGENYINAESKLLEMHRVGLFLTRLKIKNLILK